MELTPEAVRAANARVRELTNDRPYGASVSVDEVVSILDAAFATIPDPTALADKWSEEATSFEDEGEPEVASVTAGCAAELREFMRGES